QDEQYILFYLLKAITIPNPAKFDSDFSAKGQFPPSELTPGDKHLVSQAAPTFNLRFIQQVDLRAPVQHDLICAQQRVSCVQRERESRFFHPHT
ncbi:MAG: hypothetical protein DMF98_17600, partial [Acidobacteria bacterium]